MTEPELVKNYVLEQNSRLNLPEQITFWDETLRDGEQTPGVSYTRAEKLELAKLIDEVGVDIINLGIPVISHEELETIRAIAKEGLKTSTLAAARTVPADIDAVIASEVAEIAIFVPCSDLHLKYKLRKTRTEVLAMTQASVDQAKEAGLLINFVTEDTFRSDLDFVTELYNLAIEAGAKRSVLCDTVGVMTPHTMKWYFTQLVERFSATEFSIHCHNDFGMATANTLAAIEAGASVPHTVVNGLGERSGNAPFAEVVMALETLYRFDTGLRLDRLQELAEKVELYSGVPIGITKPVVGYNAFSHESGIHTDGMLKHTLTYEPMDPATLARERQYILGKHTGSKLVLEKLRGAGIDLTDDQVQELVERIKHTAETRDKSELRQRIIQYRRHEEQRRGVSEAEFWRFVEEAGGKAKFDVGVRSPAA